MVSPEEIRNVTFEKGMRGYRTEDVDAFLQNVAADVEKLIAEKAETEQQLYVLAQKIEEYRNDEDNLKTALLNAQRMGENVIKEAKQKAETILRKAGIQADDLTRGAREQVEEQELALARAKAEVAQFKNDVLSLYREHIQSLSTLPGSEPEEEEQPAEENETAEAVEPAEQPAEEKTGAEEEIQTENFPDLATLYEEPQTAEVQVETTEESAEEDQTKHSFTDTFDGFQGIKFSD